MDKIFRPVATHAFVTPPLFDIELHTWRVRFPSEPADTHIKHYHRQKDMVTNNDGLLDGIEWVSDTKIR